MLFFHIAKRHEQRHRNIIVVSAALYLTQTADAHICPLCRFFLRHVPQRSIIRNLRAYHLQEKFFARVELLFNFSFGTSRTSTAVRAIQFLDIKSFLRVKFLLRLTFREDFTRKIFCAVFLNCSADKRICLLMFRKSFLKRARHLPKIILRKIARNFFRKRRICRQKFLG